MAEEEDSAEKEYEPTERKLQKARERGEVPKSTELTVAAAYGGVLIAGFGVGAAAFGAFGTSAMVLLDQADTLAPLFLGGHTGPVAGLLGEVLIAIAPWFVIPFLLVLATVFAYNLVRPLYDEVLRTGPSTAEQPARGRRVPARRG